MGTSPSPVRFALRLLGCLLPALACTACLSRGRVYTRTVQPYMTEFRDTPVGTRVCRVSEHLVKEPVSGAGVSATWTTRAIAEAACRAGITNLYYMDVETLSVLNSLYRRRTLILYGD
jgi:hypothetical protein